MEAITKRRIFYALAAVAVMVVILLLPTPSRIVAGAKTIALSSSAKASLAVLAMAVILWMTEAVPFPITGLLAIVALVMTKAVPFEQLVRDGFGNHIILFFIGVLILSSAIGQTSLLRRLTIFLLYHFGHKPRIIILVFLIAGALMSGWITDMAVAAIMLPIGVVILRDAAVQPMKSNFGKALMISCAWGPLIGGITTPAGCGPNPLTMGFLKDLAGIDFSFTDWMLLGFPAAILMLPCAWLILLRVFPIEDIDLSIAEDDLRRRFREIGPIMFREILTLIIFLLTVCLWIFAPWIRELTNGAVDYLSISFVSIACACLFFMPGIGVFTWEKVEKEIGWGGVILVVSGLSLGMAIYKTGAAEWLAWIAFNRIGFLHPVLIVFVVVFGVSLMKVAFSSNTVTGIIIVPLLIALAKNLGIDPVLMAIPAGITSSLAFILVTSTPTNVIPYSAGYFSIRDMAKAGIWMTIASSICVTASICIMGRLTGVIKL